MRFAREIRGTALHLDIISLGRGQGPRTEEAISKAHQLKGKWIFLTKFPPCCIIYAATLDDCEKVRGGDSKIVIVLHNLLCASPLDVCLRR